jgi:hypothetical protein
MRLISTADRNKLYRQLKHEVGFPQRPFELTDEQLDSFFEMALEDYSSYLNEWLIEQQWVGLQGLDLSENEFVTAFTTKSNNFMKSFTFAYSKQVGLGTNAPASNSYELKRDFIVTSANTQHYIIPANREINEVLWETPPSIDQGLVDPFALTNWASGSFGWSYMGRPAQYVQPTYSLLLSAQDRRTKERILQSELTYRITGLEDGRKILHLYPIPGTRNEIRDRFGKHYAGRKVWYWYYDTSDGDRDKCLELNDDTVKLPSDSPVNLLKWDNVNQVARQQIRDLFFAKSMVAMSRIRGFFSGDVGSVDKQLQMDYRMFGEAGEKLKEETRTKIFESLQKISQVQLTADRASIAENVNRERGYQPPQFPIMSY